MKGEYALYRLPFADTYTELRQPHGSPLQFSSFRELNGKSGFVFAPFSISSACPILLLSADEINVRPVSSYDKVAYNLQTVDRETEKAQYHQVFSHFIEQLGNGTFDKIVLARCSHCSTQENIEPLNLFLKACHLYPRMFIALVNTSVSGTWLMATPEILLSGSHNQWSTMALAGTMQLSQCGETVLIGRPAEHWSHKNMHEQGYVSSYISECLQRFGHDIKVNGPYTVRAGNVVHLRSDFTFKLPDDRYLGDLISVLHPTPAVCGLPKHAACQYILANESEPRLYYSGFVGPLCLHDFTHLYVSLRCMHIHDDCYDMYAGGGLLSESDEQMEFDETQAKMHTMRRLFDC